MLDPEQNKDFLDHYLDVRCDLSNILFIVTANILDTIPEPLKDRMDILRLSGYILEEKVQDRAKISDSAQPQKWGLKLPISNLPEELISHIINGYAREAGVRSFENHIKKILRKVAVKLSRAREKKGEANSKRSTDLRKESRQSFWANRSSPPIAFMKEPLSASAWDLHGHRWAEPRCMSKRPKCLQKKQR